MHKIRIVAIGRDKDQWVTDSCAHFEKLLKKYARIEWDLIAVPGSRSFSPAETKRNEAERLFPRLEGSYVVALADTGVRMESRAFAKWLEKALSHHSNRLAFVIGGPYGLDQSILDAANETLSLSPLTFSHQLVRPVLLEQLYRAFSILGGSDYHK